MSNPSSNQDVISQDLNIEPMQLELSMEDVQEEALLLTQLPPSQQPFDMRQPTSEELYFQRLATEVQRERGGPSIVGRREELEVPVQPELSLEDLPNQPLPATQRRRLLRNIKQFQNSTVTESTRGTSNFHGLQKPTQRSTHIPLLGEPGFSARHPSELIFPPLPTRVLERLEPLVDDLNVPWFGDLILDSSTALVILLTKGRTTTNSEELLFETIYEGLVHDHYWGLFAYPLHSVDREVGHNQWLYGQPRLLSRDQRGVHVADIVQWILRFLEMP
jgi:hypothetical protein